MDIDIVLVCAYLHAVYIYNLVLGNDIDSAIHQ